MQENLKPKQTISVIIPVHNGQKYLAEAIQTVLCQTRSADEILVVDDGSTDDSAKIAASFGSPVQVLQQPNLGPASARNLGVKQAQGNLLAFLDADDLWSPEKLAAQEQILAKAPDCAAVLGQVENFISPELDAAQQLTLKESVTRTGVHHIGALLIRRAAFLQIGYFDTQWRHGEFIAWWAAAKRVELNYQIMPQLMLRRRLHTSNLTRREPEGRRQYLGVLREQLALRRAAGLDQNAKRPE
ncbi:MAG: glycosyltransferase family 2 protein [bacterium]|nr:glycosyltransferase family 2 protein [bacterium]